MISSIFESVPDYRVVGRCRYKLADLLTNALVTILILGEDYTDMSTCAEERGAELGLFTDCGGHYPSPDTFERVLSNVDPEAVMECIRLNWGDFLYDLNEKQIVIDGKKLRGASPKSTGTQGEWLLNAFVSETNFFLTQEHLTDKENEITAIPRILDKLDITGATISIDAIGTQIDIAQKIVDNGGHYFLAVKENQGGLNQSIKDAFRWNNPSDTHSDDIDKNHGRIEVRECKILSADTIEDETIRNRWPGLKTIVEITSHVDYGDHQARMIRRYISDEDFPKAAYYNMLARGHWSIENQLHWCLDVIFKEDESRARKGYAAQNLSLLRKLSLQIVKNYNDKKSLKKKRFTAALNTKYLKKLLNNYQF